MKGFQPMRASLLTDTLPGSSRGMRSRGTGTAGCSTGDGKGRDSSRGRSSPGIQDGGRGS